MMAKLVKLVCEECGQKVRSDNRTKKYRHAAIGVAENHPVKTVKTVVLIESY